MAVEPLLSHQIYLIYSSTIVLDRLLLPIPIPLVEAGSAIGVFTLSSASVKQRPLFARIVMIFGNICCKICIFSFYA